MQQQEQMLLTSTNSLGKVFTSYQVLNMALLMESFYIPMAHESAKTMNSMFVIHRQAEYKCLILTLTSKEHLAKEKQKRIPSTFQQIVIDFDAAGNVYVTDPWNNRIQVFDSRGDGIRSIGRSHLMTPAGLFIRDELIYTTEYLSSKISILTMSGRLVTTVGINKPNGITVGEDGLVYATSNQSKIVVLQP
jgi:hypothetical protein